MSDTISFDVNEFRAAFPAFADEDAYPTATLQLYWDQATCWISDKNWGWLQNECRRYALNLMTAHIAYLNTIIANGQTTGVVQSSTIDKITVSLTPPPFEIGGYFSWWATQSPYGQTLYAFLSERAVGGFYVPGGCGGLWF